MATDSAPLMHGFPWTIQKLKGYWMSEKLDGVRAYWDGEWLLSRDSKPIQAPLEFLKRLPVGLPLDGELWAGRGNFQHVNGAVRSERHPAWKEIVFRVFDLPASPLPYEARQIALKAAELTFPPVLAVTQTLCEGLHHMKRELRKVAAKGGEGLMMIAPGSLYTPGRTHSVLKVRIANNTELL